MEKPSTKKGLSTSNSTPLLPSSSGKNNSPPSYFIREDYIKSPEPTKLDLGKEKKTRQDQPLVDTIVDELQKKLKILEIEKRTLQNKQAEHETQAKLLDSVNQKNLALEKEKQSLNERLIQLEREKKEFDEKNTVVLPQVSPTQMKKKLDDLTRANEVITAQLISRDLTITALRLELKTLRDAHQSTHTALQQAKVTVDQKSVYSNRARREQ